jgi:serralysin
MKKYILLIIVLFSAIYEGTIFAEDRIAPKDLQYEDTFTFKHKKTYAVGGLGNDTYTIDVLTDIIAEKANEGTDLVNVAVASAGGTYTLAASVENATLINTAAYNLTGNDLNNVLNGNVANNILIGGTGNDTVNGLGGNDNLAGGLGNDLFNFSSVLSATNIDTIGDFLSGTDKIALGSAIFTQLFNDTNLSDNFVVGGTDVKAIDANDYLIYNSFSKGLFYDADGSGAGTALQFATLNNVNSLSATDFVVI